MEACQVTLLPELNMTVTDPTGNPASLEDENRRLKRAVTELTILNELAAAIDSTMSTDDIMNLIVQESIKSIGVEQGAIMMITEKAASPMKTLIRGMDASSGGIPYRLGVSLTGWMLKNQKPLLIEDFSTDERSDPFGAECSPEGEGPHDRSDQSDQQKRWPLYPRGRTSGGYHRHPVGPGPGERPAV